MSTHTRTSRNDRSRGGRARHQSGGEKRVTFGDDPVSEVFALSGGNNGPADSDDAGTSPTTLGIPDPMSSSTPSATASVTSQGSLPEMNLGQLGSFDSLPGASTGASLDSFGSNGSTIDKMLSEAIQSAIASLGSENAEALASAALDAAKTVSSEQVSDAGSVTDEIVDALSSKTDTPVTAVVEAAEEKLPNPETAKVDNEDPEKFAAAIAANIFRPILERAEKQKQTLRKFEESAEAFVKEIADTIRSTGSIDTAHQLALRKAQENPQLARSVADEVVAHALTMPLPSTQSSTGSMKDLAEKLAAETSSSAGTAESSALALVEAAAAQVDQGSASDAALLSAALSNEHAQRTPSANPTLDIVVAAQKEASPSTPPVVVIMSDVIEEIVRRLNNQIPRQLAADRVQQGMQTALATIQNVQQQVGANPEPSTSTEKIAGLLQDAVKTPEDAATLAHAIVGTSLASSSGADKCENHDANVKTARENNAANRPHENLGLAPNASAAEIAKACRKKRADTHPQRYKCRDDPSDNDALHQEIGNSCDRLTGQDQSKIDPLDQGSHQLRLGPATSSSASPTVTPQNSIASQPTIGSHISAAPEGLTTAASLSPENQPLPSLTSSEASFLAHNGPAAAASLIPENRPLPSLTSSEASFLTQEDVQGVSSSTAQSETVVAGHRYIVTRPAPSAWVVKNLGPASAQPELAATPLPTGVSVFLDDFTRTEVGGRAGKYVCNTATGTAKGGQLDDAGLLSYLMLAPGGAPFDQFLENRDGKKDHGVRVHGKDTFIRTARQSFVTYSEDPNTDGREFTRREAMSEPPLFKNAAKVTGPPDNPPRFRFTGPQTVTGGMSVKKPLQNLFNSSNASESVSYVGANRVGRFFWPTP